MQCKDRRVGRVEGAPQGNSNWAIIEVLKEAKKISDMSQNWNAKISSKAIETES